MRKTATPQPRVKAEILFHRAEIWFRRTQKWRTRAHEELAANRDLLILFKGTALTTRLWNCLVQLRVKTIADIEKIGTDELLRTPNFAKRSYQELRELVPSLPPLGKSAQKSQIGPEIEITDEMIEAGRYELADYSPREDDPAAAVYSIFLAMWNARPGAGADNQRNRTTD
jgi:hypothetical protein